MLYVIPLLEYLTQVTLEKIHFEEDLQNIKKFVFTCIVLRHYTFTLEIISCYYTYYISIMLFYEFKIIDGREL